MVKGVVIIGSKGVGKTSLFKLLISKFGEGRLKKINDSPVTNYHQYLVKIGSGYYNLIDTPPLTDSLAPKFTLEKDLQGFINGLIKNKGDLIVWVLDKVDNQALSFAQQVFKKMKMEKCVILNKTDLQTYENPETLYSLLGTKRVFQVSFLTRHNLEQVISFLEEVADDSQPSPSLFKARFTLLIIGIPNSGKSTLMNAMLNEDRSLVSSIKGTTREPVSAGYSLEDLRFELVDTAGVEEEGELNKGLWRRSHLALIVIDATLPLTKQVLRLASLGIKTYKSSIVVVNKADLVDNAPYILGELRSQLHSFSYSSIIATSALKREGIGTLVNRIRNIIFQSEREFTRKELEKLTEEITRGHPNKKIRVYFIKQKKGETGLIQRFIFFLNQPRLANNAYEKYSLNKIQKELGLVGIPIQVIFKKSEGKDYSLLKGNASSSRKR